MIMVAIAFDRYLSICQPLVGALTSRKAWLVSAVLGVFAAAIGVCVALMYSVEHYVPLSADDARNQFSSNQSTPVETTSTTDAGIGRGSESAWKDEALSTAECPATSRQPATVEVDRGECYPTDDVFSTDFIWYFQKAYNGLFLICLIVVVKLYVLIYRSVLLRRNRRQWQRNRSVWLITSYSQRLGRPTTTHSFISAVGDAEGTELREMQPEGQETAEAAASTTADDAMLRAVRDRKRNRVANLKTAAMLFVVTVVFVVTFLPAFLMTVHLVPYSMIIFYMYFANNVANPIIYSFMNHNFRGHLRRMICGRGGHLANLDRTWANDGDRRSVA